MKQPTETDLVRACLQLLAWSNVVAKSWRSNTGVAMLPGKGGVPRPVKFGERGAPDIMGVIAGTGRTLMVECKMPKGKLTPEQREFLDAIHRAGGVALVIRDPSELNAALAHLATDPHWQPRTATGGAAS